jgi:hypothetical protein
MAEEIYLRFYEELNDYLPPDRKKREFPYQINGVIGIGQMLQALSVPASEVELVMVNGSSADLAHFLFPGDHVSIYPVFESLDVKSLLTIRREPLRRLRFVTDPDLSPLASSLRFLGFDVIVEHPVRVAEIAEKEHRILLTADPAFADRRLSRVYVVKKINPKEQLEEVLSRFDLGNGGRHPISPKRYRQPEMR